MDLLAVQGILKSLQHHSSKASILWHSAFCIVQFSHPYMTTGKTLALTRWTFVGKVISLLFNKLALAIGFFKCVYKATGKTGNFMVLLTIFSRFLLVYGLDGLKCLSPLQL